MCAGGCGGGKKKPNPNQISIAKQMKQNQQPKKQEQTAKILPFTIKGDKSKTLYFPRIQM